jgi:inositol transport system substrate-binding protein
MDKSKRIFVVIAALLCLASFAFAAGQQQGGAADGKVGIGVTLYDRDQFISSLEQAILEAAKAYPEVAVDSQDAKQDVNQQLAQVDVFATKKHKAIIVNLINTDTVETIIERAKGIPTIFVNRRPRDAVIDGVKTAYVGSQEYDAGRMQGEYLSTFFKGKKTELKYVLFMGQLGLENTNERTRGVKETLEKNGFTLTKVYEDTAEWDRFKAMNQMQQLIGTKRPFDVVICNNDEMALGAIEAMKSTGMDLKAIPVVGIDATPPAKEAVKAGTMAMTVFQNAKAQGKVALEFALKAAKGEKIEKFGWVPFEPVTLENVSKY